MGFGARIPPHRERTLTVFPALLRKVSDVRRTGSAAYDLCCVACGRADAYLELGINLYDYGAGYVIVTEAGGSFSGWAVGEDGLTSGNPLASNGVIHEEIRALVNE
jgi:myo-inositol-1(or 4)-monophosphatase